MLNLGTTQRGYIWAKNPQTSLVLCQIGSKTHSSEYRTPYFAWFLLHYSRKMGIVNYFFHLQTISLWYNTITKEYSTIIVQRYSTSTYTGFRVPINEEIWLPLVRWALNPVIWDVVTGHRHLFCLIWVDEVGFVFFYSKIARGIIYPYSLTSTLWFSR